MSGIADYFELQSMLKSITNKELKIILLNNSTCKINVPDSDNYRGLADKLSNTNIE